MRTSKFCIWCAAVFLLVSPASATERDTSNSSNPNNIGGEQRRRYIVEFADPPVVSVHGRGRTLHRHARHVVDHVRYLRARQDEALRAVLPQPPDDEDEGDDDLIVKRYHYAFNGVTVHLTDDEAEKLREESHVVDLWAEGFHQLIPIDESASTLSSSSSTTVIPLTHRGEAYAATGLDGEDIVIGIIDSGIVPENPSFADAPTKELPDLVPYGPPPSQFAGTKCVFGRDKFNDNRDDASFECNNKILAAQCYVMSYSNKLDDKYPCGGDGANLQYSDHFFSARDDAVSGHGSHVASTAAGNAGVTAVINDKAVAVISGVAPRARLSVYKACWDGGCGYSDSLAALEDAVTDGVDVINYSIGGRSESPVEWAFLNVVQAGIVAVASAGNSGPNPSTVGFPAGMPWMVAVAAQNDPYGSAIIMNIVSPLSIAGRVEFRSGSGGGADLVKPEQYKVFTEDLVVSNPLEACSVPSNDLTGKVALVRRGSCLFTDKFQNAAAAGAKAIIIYNDGTAPDRMGLLSMMLDPTTTIPGVFVAYETGHGLRTVLEKGQDPPVMAVEFFPTANLVADFSSRGPNDLYSASLLKPDVTAPGTRILAASTPLAAGVVNDEDRSDFGFLQGTSMSSPHVAGYMAILKQAHPTWSPSRLRSALMTTAQHEDLLRDFLPDPIPATPLDVGAGLARVEVALEPGLVYDTTIDGYKAAHCGYNKNEVGKDVCKELSNQGYSSDVIDLNYPSIAASRIKTSFKTTRTVTNVASTPVLYKAVLEAPNEFDISVSPCQFILNNEESISFEITISATTSLASRDWLFGSLTWLGVEAISSDTRPQDVDGGSSCSTAPPPTRQRFLRQGTFEQNKKNQMDKNSRTATPTMLPTARPSKSPTSSPSVSPSALINLAPAQADPAAQIMLPTTSPTSSEALTAEETTEGKQLYTVYSPIVVSFEV